MSSTDQHPAKDQWRTINQLANWYGKSAAFVRLKINKAFKEKFGKIPETDVSSVYQRREGPFACLYHVDFAKDAIGWSPDQHLTEVQRGIFNRQTKLPTVRIVGSEVDGLLTGLLGSRMKASEAYEALLIEMIGSGRGLRIRCITGTDFFNAHRPTADAFFERVNNGLDAIKIKILLVYPFGHGARVRSAAEGDKRLDMSQFSRDAAGTFGFVSSYARKLKLDARWSEDLPPSLLVWTEDYALVEPYDHGRQDEDRSGCIGRKSPIMIVSGGTPYHTTLKHGFDYVFDSKEKKEKEEDTHIKTFSLEEVAAEYNKRATPVAIPRHPRQAKNRAQSEVE